MHIGQGCGCDGLSCSLVSRLLGSNKSKVSIKALTESTYVEIICFLQKYHRLSLAMKHLR